MDSGAGELMMRNPYAVAAKPAGGIAMRRSEQTTLEYTVNGHGITRHVTLIDPAKQDPNIAANRAMVAIEAGSAMIFVSSPSGS